MGAMEELEKMKSLQVLNASGMDINRVLTVEIVSQASIWPWVPKPRVQMSLASLSSSLVSLNLSNCNLIDDAFPRDLKLSKLQDLSLNGNPISSLPNFIKDHTSLVELNLRECSKLQQILWPSTSLRTLVVDECDALEKITFGTGFNYGLLTHLYCPKLNHIQGNYKVSPVREVDVELLNSIGFFNLDSMADVEAITIVNGIEFSRKKRPIQILYQDRTFHTFFPGREVPQWFSKKNGGATLSFTVTLPPHFSFRGLNLCAVYTLPVDIVDYVKPWQFTFSFEISSKILCMKTVFKIQFYGIPEKGGDMVWLSHCFEANLFTEGDEVDVSFRIEGGGQIKECGVHLLYFEEEGEVFQHVSTIQRSWDPYLNLYEPYPDPPVQYRAAKYRPGEYRTVTYASGLLKSSSNGGFIYPHRLLRPLVNPLNSGSKKKKTTEFGCMK